jgi:hypothetical protein
MWSHVAWYMAVTFWMDVLNPFLGQRQVRKKHSYQSTKLQGVTFQKTVIVSGHDFHSTQIQIWNVTQQVAKQQRSEFLFGMYHVTI